MLLINTTGECKGFFPMNKLLFYKHLNYYTIFIVLCFQLFLAGCEGVKEEKKEGEVTFNSVVYDPNFQALMQPYPIRLIAPASGIDPNKIPALQSLTFLKLSIPENLIVNKIPYHSNSDADRLEMLKQAIYEAPEKIIWTLRGGYGTARLIDSLRTLPTPKNEKIFIGSSDNTALHLFMSQHWGWKTIHGAGLNGLLNPNQDPENFSKLAQLIAHKKSNITIDHLVPMNNAANAVKKANQKISGKLTGGNISIIQTSIGTDWQIQSEGKILFLEEVNEKGYQVDRLLHHLKQAGVFKGVKAIVFGDFADPKDEWVELALERFAKEMDIPIYKTDEFGHGTKNYPLIYNSESEINGTTLNMKW